MRDLIGAINIEFILVIIHATLIMIVCNENHNQRVEKLQLLSL